MTFQTGTTTTTELGMKLKREALEALDRGDLPAATEAIERLEAVARLDADVPGESQDAMFAAEYSARGLIVLSLVDILAKKATTQRQVDQFTAIGLALSSYAKDNIAELVELAELSPASEAMVRKGLGVP